MLIFFVCADVINNTYKNNFIYTNAFELYYNCINLHIFNLYTTLKTVIRFHLFFIFSKGLNNFFSFETFTRIFPDRIQIKVVLLTHNLLWEKCTATQKIDSFSSFRKIIFFYSPACTFIVSISYDNSIMITTNLTYDFRSIYSSINKIFRSKKPQNYSPKIIPYAKYLC